MIRLLLVDDHPIVRDGLRGLCDAAQDFHVVGEASDGEEAVDAVRSTEPDVVLMDLRMPGAGGVEAIRRIRGEHGERVRIVVLTTFDTDQEIGAALEAGATGYLLKDAPRDELFAAIRAAADGRTVLSPAVAARAGSPSVGDVLSARELDVLAQVAKGRSNREIARELFISEATVKTHLGHVYDKLGAADRAAAVAIGYDRGLLGT